MPIPELDAMVMHWQQELKLLDWTLDVRCIPDLTNRAGQPVYGLCMAVADNKSALILIRDPATPVGDADMSVDERVIHELGHCHLSPLKLSAPADVTVEENTVWAFAGALARAKGTPQQGEIARAMVAGFQRITKAAMAGGTRMDDKTKEAIKAAMADPEARSAIKQMFDDSEPKKEEPKKEAAEEEKAPDSEKKEEPKKEAKAARAPLTLADVQRVTDEALERAALIAANRSRMTDGQAAIYARQPLATVKEAIAALPTAGATEPGALVRAQDPSRAGGVSGNPAAREAVANLMGLPTAARQAVTIGEDGSLSISHLASFTVADKRPGKGS